jgi:hypothetical protein
MLQVCPCHRPAHVPHGLALRHVRAASNAPRWRRYDIVKHFQLDELKLVRYLMRIEDGYPTNPYHNRIHASDVLQSLHVLVARGGLRDKEYCDDVSLLACYLSAVSAAAVSPASRHPTAPVM